MRLHTLSVSGFRRFQKVIVNFGDATFLIGPNNSGKSSVLRAVEVLLSSNKTLPQHDYYSEIDPTTGETKPKATEVEFEAEFRNLPTEAQAWRGFKGRTFEYEPISGDDSGLSIVYKKVF